MNESHPICKTEGFREGREAMPLVYEPGRNASTHGAPSTRYQDRPFPGLSILLFLVIS